MASVISQALMVRGGAPLTFTHVGILSWDDFSTPGAYPAVQAGDLAVLLDHTVYFSDPGAVVPSGYTILQNVVPVANSRTVLSYKILTGSESGAIGGNPSYTGFYRAFYLVRPSRAIAGITSGTLNYEQTAGNPAVQTITAPVGGPTLNIAMNVSQSPGTALICSPAMANVSTPSTANRAEHLIQNTSPVNQTVDMNDLGTLNALYSAYIKGT